MYIRNVHKQKTHRILLAYVKSFKTQCLYFGNKLAFLKKTAVFLTFLAHLK